MYKFTGIVDKPYDQKRERKSKPIIIIIANYKNPNPPKDQPGMKRCLKKINNLTWKLVVDWSLQEAGTNWPKTGNRNVLLRQDMEIHQHGSGGWISIAACAHNKDDNKQNEDDK
jgi:hypothetical protein